MDDYPNQQNYTTTRDYSGVVNNSKNQPPQPQKNFFKWFLVTLGILCLVTILGVGYLLFNLGKSSSANNTSSKQATIVQTNTSSVQNTSLSSSTVSSASSASKKTFTDPNIPSFSLEQGDWVLKETTQPSGTGKYYSHVFTKGDATFTVAVGNYQSISNYDTNALGICLTDDQLFDMGDGWFRAKFSIEGPVLRRFVKSENVKFDRKSGKGYAQLGSQEGLIDITCPDKTVATLDAQYDAIINNKIVSFYLSPENVIDRTVADSVVKSIKY
jgi:hypothetical protein